MKLIKVFLSVIIFCSSILLSVQNSFKIVGLFHENDNPQAEMAFRYGIDRFNMFNTEIRFSAVIKKVTTYDSFETSKLVCDLVSTIPDIVAIFGPTSQLTSTMVSSICGNLELSHIQTASLSTDVSTSGTILNVFPSSDVLSQCLATLVRHMEWSSYTILYQRDDALVRLQEVLKIADTTSAPVTIRQLNEDGDYRSLLKELKNAKETHFIVDCDLDKIMDILNQAKEVKLLEFFQSYFFTPLDTHLLDFESLNTTANITMLRLIDPENPAVNFAVRDWELGELNNNRLNQNMLATEVTTEAALMHDAITFFTSSFHELHVTEEITSGSLSCTKKQKWSTGYRIVNYMKVRPLLNGLTGNVSFNEEGQRVDFTAQLVELIHGKLEKTATWLPKEPETLQFTRSASQQMQQIVENLQKTTVIVSSRIGPPYLINREPEFEGQVLEGNARYEGFSMDIIDGIAKELNFTYRFELAEDGKYGNYVPENKSWNGLIKDLIDRKAHLAICDLTITHQRREAVDFSLPFMTLGISILYSKSKPSERNIFAFMEPLDNTVWIYIMSSYVSVTLIVFCVTRMAPGDWENPNPMSNEAPEELENIWTFKNCLWLVLGSTMSQGCDMLPKGISSRMAASMWWFFILIISSSYTANLAAFLTMDKMAPSIDGAEALAKQTKIKYGTVVGGSTQTFFKESNFSTYARMWTSMESARPSAFEKSNVDGVKRVLTTKNQGYAFLMESSSIEYEIERNCELKQIGQRLDSKGYGIAMPVNSPYRSAINSAVLKMQEEGKLAQLKNKWWKEMHGGGACDGVGDSEESAAELKLTNVGGVFLVLGISVVIAFIFCIVDIVWNVHKVSVKRHITHREALKMELLFALKVWKTEKPVLQETTSSLSIKMSQSQSQSQQTLTNNKSLKSVKSATSCTQTF